jgi:hypothetical protein
MEMFERNETGHPGEVASWFQQAVSAPAEQTPFYSFNQSPRGCDTYEDYRYNPLPENYCEALSLNTQPLPNDHRAT